MTATPLTNWYAAHARRALAEASILLALDAGGIASASLSEWTAEDERLHPRAEDGKFGKKTGLAKKEKEPKADGEPAGGSGKAAEGDKSAANEPEKAKGPRPHVHTPEFKAWFADSKVVDESGEPLVVYHGTNQDFDTFRAGHTIKGSFATDSEEDAKRFADPIGGDKKAHIKNLYMSIKNPRIYNEEGKEFDFKRVNSFVVRARSDGYDGVIVRNVRNFPDAKPSTSYIAFEPTQIKSVDNAGTFDPGNPRIDLSWGEPPTDPAPVAEAALAFDESKVNRDHGRFAEKAGGTEEAGGPEPDGNDGGAPTDKPTAAVRPGPHDADLKEGEAKRQGLVGKWSAKVSAAVDKVPVVGHAKRAMEAAMAKIHAVAAARYGPKTASMIMASGTVVDLALMGGGMALAGIPVVTGFNQLLGIIPAFVLAEGKYLVTGGKKFTMEDPEEFLGRENEGNE